MAAEPVEGVAAAAILLLHGLEPPREGIEVDPRELVRLREVLCPAPDRLGDGDASSDER